MLRREAWGWTQPPLELIQLVLLCCYVCSYRWSEQKPEPRTEGGRAWDRWERYRDVVDESPLNLYTSGHTHTHSCQWQREISKGNTISKAGQMCKTDILRLNLKAARKLCNPFKKTPFFIDTHKQLLPICSHGTRTFIRLKITPLHAYQLPSIQHTPMGFFHKLSPKCVRSFSTRSNVIVS